MGRAAPHPRRYKPSGPSRRPTVIAVSMAYAAGIQAGPRVRRLTAGGREIRTLGPPGRKSGLRALAAHTPGGSPEVPARGDTDHWLRYSWRLVSSRQPL